MAVAGTEILSALLEPRPDAAVLDARMPPDFRDEGLRPALAAPEEIPGLPVLVLSRLQADVLRPARRPAPEAAEDVREFEPAAFQQ